MLERFNGLGKTESGKLKLVTSSEHAHTHTHTHTQCETRDQKLLWTRRVPLSKGN